jgi:uncharacterized protein (UPF0261 family)
MSTIAILGTLDSKGEEHAFSAALVKARGHVPLLIDVGTGSDPTVVPDITRYQVAEAAAMDLVSIIARKNRHDEAADKALFGAIQNNSPEFASACAEKRMELMQR